MTAPSVYVHGRDGIGWAIDQERMYAERFLLDLGFRLAKTPVLANVVHNVWWNLLLRRRYYPLRWKRKVIATATNEIDTRTEAFRRASAFVRLWVAASKKQVANLERAGVRAAYQPFYVDEAIFQHADRSKEAIADELGIDYQQIRDKVLIGSFQRDSDGRSLSMPKMVKGPDLLVSMLAELPDRDKWLLVLAGPRRHYIIRECERQGIPYYYYGESPKPEIDDLAINSLPIDRMPALYNLIDCYAITSRSEGGPKAVIEAARSGAFPISSDVGMAPDLLDPRCIYRTHEEGVALLGAFIDSPDAPVFDELRESNRQTVLRECSFAATRRRWQAIYEALDD